MRLLLLRSKKLGAEPFTYAAVGATATTPPHDYEVFTRAHVLNHQDTGRAVRDLMSWQVQQRTGLKGVCCTVR